MNKDEHFHSDISETKETMALNSCAPTWEDQMNYFQSCVTSKVDTSQMPQSTSYLPPTYQCFS